LNAKANSVVRPRNTGSRFQLGKELDEKIADFCEANLGVPNATEIARRAIHAFIDGYLATDRAMKARYEEARRKRVNMPAPKVVQIKPK
jgi:hypothetical protein